MTAVRGLAFKHILFYSHQASNLVCFTNVEEAFVLDFSVRDETTRRVSWIGAFAIVGVGCCKEAAS